MSTSSDSLCPWVIVSAGFHPQGGQAKAVAALARYLLRIGHPVHLVGHEFEPELRSGRRLTVHKVARPLSTDALGNWFLARAGRAVAKEVTAADPTARVVVNGGNCSWADINWVHFLHAAWRPDLSKAPGWFRAKEKFIGGWYLRNEAAALQSASLIITNSHRTRSDLLRSLSGIASERVRPIYYGADPKWSLPDEQSRCKARAEFGASGARPIVVFVGGLGHDNRKGVDSLLAAWGELCKLPQWDADLYMAGGGKAEGALVDMIQKAGITQRVKPVGFTDRIFELLAAADLLVSPVRYEPYGLNVQEAICRGVPAIVSARAGVAEHYAGPQVDMILPNPDDSADLARRLLAWRSDPGGWRERFRVLSEQLRTRTWDAMSAEIVAAAQTTLAAPPKVATIASG